MNKNLDIQCTSGYLFRSEIQENAVSSVIGYFHIFKPSFNEAHEKGELSISQRRGIITLILKEDRSLLDLSNWRPITLLNVDLKIALKA